jgi:hypothetical protein
VKFLLQKDLSGIGHMKKGFSNQPALFDIAPIKVDRVAVAQRNIEIARMKSAIPVVYVVFYKNGTDVSHWSMPQNKVQDSYDKYEKFEVFQPAEYWQKFHDKEFQAGR